MKRLLYFLCLFGILTSLVSCNGQEVTADEITIYGNVIDKTTGQPLYNVLVKEKNNVGGSTVTGSDGNYEFSLPLNGSSNGKYYLVASKDQYVSEEYELNMSSVDKNRHVKVDFQLVKNLITYVGQVTDNNGTPMAGVLVEEARYNMGTSYTDSNGQYKLEVPAYSSKNWWYTIQASKEGYVTKFQEFSHTPSDVGRTYNVNFTLIKNIIIISGKVTNTSGKAIANADISHYVGDGNGWKGALYSTTQTNSNGEYELIYMRGDEAVAYHTFECSAYGYAQNVQELYTTYEDVGKKYTINFVLTK